MSSQTTLPPLLTFADADKSPLSIRAKALMFVDPRSRQLRNELEELAPRTQAVLIEGETGTGKELLARYVHRNSERGGLFVAVNCASISPKHVEAELFGHASQAAGLYGGLPSSRAGWFGSANGGTLYLDEVGDLPLAIQEKLLAALENHEATRVGATQPSPLNVRLVAATSIDLRLAVRAGKFNERLFQYLNEGRLYLPALRERVGDILPLAEYFLGIYSQRLGLAPPLLSDAAQRALQQHAWPGNTRELENIVHFALLVCAGDEILEEHLQLAPVAREPAQIDLSGYLQQASRDQLQTLFEQLSRRLNG